MILLCIFFGAIAYAITGSFLWAVIIGSAGWLIIVGVLLYGAAFVAVIFEDLKRKKSKRP